MRAFLAAGAGMVVFEQLNSIVFSDAHGKLDAPPESTNGATDTAGQFAALADPDRRRGRSCVRNNTFRPRATLNLTCSSLI